MGKPQENQQKLGKTAQKETKLSKISQNGRTVKNV